MVKKPKKPWRLIFVKGLVKYLDGESHWTFRVHRPGSNDFVKGQIIEGHFEEGFMLLMEVVEKPIVKRFHQISATERYEWNNRQDISYDDTMALMEKHNPGVTGDHLATLIKLRLARIDDRPIAAFLL